MYLWYEKGEDNKVWLPAFNTPNVAPSHAMTAIIQHWNT